MPTHNRTKTDKQLKYSLWFPTGLQELQQLEPFSNNVINKIELHREKVTDFWTRFGKRIGENI